MAKVNYSQTNFTAGELSPKLYSRSDIEGYNAGVKTMKNMVTRAQGPVARRDGTKFIKSFDASYGRVFDFEASDASGLGGWIPVVITNDGKLTLVGTVSSGDIAGQQVLLNNSFNDEGDDWTIVGNINLVQFTGGNCHIVAPNLVNTFAGITQAVTIPVENQNTIYKLAVRFETMPIDRFARDQAKITLRVGTTSGGSELYNTTSIGSFVDEVDADINVGTNSTLYISVLVINDSGEIEDVYNTRVIEEVRFREPASGAVGGDIEFVHDWNTQDIKDAITQMTPDGDVMYFLTPEKQPRKLTYGFDGWAFDLVSFTSPPEDWVDGSWPTSLTFYQGRSWWAGAKNEPTLILSSKSAETLADYEIFTVGALDNDSISIKNSKRGRIRWIEGGDTLIFGTEYGEFTIQARNGLITPSDLEIKQQSANGGALFKAWSVGPSVIYISRDRRRIHTADFEWTRQKWVSRDVTFMSEHLTLNRGIREIAYCRNPDSLMWFATETGDVIGATFESFSSVIGFHLHDFGDQVTSVARLENRTRSNLFISLIRNNKVILEQADIFGYLDSSVRFESPSSTTLTGLDHLEGREVQVVIDGAVTTPKTVVSGSIEIDSLGVDVLVGLSYESLLEFLPIENTAPNGSTAPYKKRRLRNFIRLIDSVLPEVNGVLPPTRTADTLMNTAQPTYTGLLEVSENGYESENNTLKVSTSRPYPLTVTGLYSEVEQSQL